MRCPVCKDNNFRPSLKKGNLRLVRCSGCGLVWVDNLSETFDIKHYDYYKERLLLRKEELYNSITAKRYINLLNRLEAYRKQNTLLDIGCGEGHFLSVAKEMGWQARGIERATYAVEICKRFNLDAVCADLLKINLEKDYYDVVVMSEVVEHLTQPKKYLLKVNDILRRGGVLRVTTPNFDCLTRYLLQERWSLINKEHLFYFTPKTLKFLLTSSNFKIIKLKVKLITLPELYRLFKPNANNGYKYNQLIRKTLEHNKILFFLKKGMNEILNLTRMGESIECICEKT